MGYHSLENKTKNRNRNKDGYCKGEKRGREESMRGFDNQNEVGSESGWLTSCGEESGFGVKRREGE